MQMTTITIKGFLAGSLVAGSALVAAPSQAADHVHGHVAEQYTVELLEPTNGGLSSGALGINNSGDVAGITRPTSSSQPQMTVLWQRHGDHFHVSELANLEGSAFSRGFDLNDSSVVVGEAFNSAGSSVPVTWNGDSAPEQVTTLTPTGTGVLRDVNNAGVIVGVASGTAVQIATDGTVSTLPAPSGDVEGTTVSSYNASSISDSGLVSGRAGLVVPHEDHTHSQLVAVVWRNGVPDVLDLPADSTGADAANVDDSGEAVGAATIANLETAVAWDADGAVTTLASPGLTDYPHTAAKALANDVIVGYAAKYAGNTSFGGAAIAWDADGAVDLNTRVADLPAGTTLQSANDINESGQIVGTATTADGKRGFVLTPVEEADPSTTLTITGVEASYAPGDTVSLTAVQDPATELDHYHWFTRPDEDDEWTVVAGELTSRLTTTASTNGTQIIARLYTSSHEAVAESAPVTLHVAARTSTVSVTTTPTTYGIAAKVTAKVATASGPASGTATFRVGGWTRTVKLSSGTAKVSLPATLPVGRSTVTVSYPGSSSASAATTTARVQVAKAPTRTTARKVGPKKVRITVAVPGTTLTARGTVKIYVKGTWVRTVRLTNGKATVRLPRSVKKSAVTVKYLGTGTFAKSMN